MEKSQLSVVDPTLTARQWGGCSQWQGRHREVGYEPKALLSGTGAGDTSIAALLTAVLNGETLDMT